jgi:hypothetical protein
MPKSQKLDDYTDKFGHLYGTADFAKFLYSIIRLQHPEVVLELGTGLGVSAFWMAQALRENNKGHIWTVDDGSDWTKNLKKTPHKEFKKHSNLRSYVDTRAKFFGLQSRLTFVNETLKPTSKFFDPEKKIDLLFADVHSGPLAVASLLAFYLPRLSSRGSIFIDRASTILSSFLMLEFLISELNHGKIPLTISERIHTKKEQANLQKLVSACRFKLVHITKQEPSDQNSVAWIKVERNDFIVDEKVTRIALF